ncbi:MAG: hypothetical protein MJE68_00140, partial [Proteobacteria bacterium]|nr:hypothetical protein [Pseudomonadota bacterium]
MFDTENVVNQRALDYLFTTEGHLIKISPSMRRRPWEKGLFDSCDSNSRAVARQNESSLAHSVSK